MPAVDPTGLSLAQAAALIAERRLSPLELTDAYLRRIERLDPLLNAYITVTADRARDDARLATEEIAAGRSCGPLHGLPIALKDLFATAGIRTTAGSRILAEWVPDADSAAARKLREAGAVLLGKLNTHEFAYGGTTINPHYGPTRNPWDTDRIPGGSSGGSAAAVAAELAAGTLGTDTAGSIRLPAAFCGVVGLKPTYGRVSKAGVVPLSWSFDHVGPITRTVEDAALLLGAIAGYDAADSSTVPMPVPDYRAALGGDLAGLRVGVPRGFFFDLLDGEVRAAVEAALVVLRDLGATVRDVELPLAEAGMNARTQWVIAESLHYHAAALRERREDFGADVLSLLTREAPDGPALTAALQTCRALAEQMRLVLEGVDVLVTPAVSIVAPRIAESAMMLSPLLVDGRETTLYAALVRCAAPFNAAHLPALALPCGFSATGLPIGVQIAGRPFDEATVLRAGHAYEQATEWHRRHPAGLEDMPTARG